MFSEDFNETVPCLDHMHIASENRHWKERDKQVEREGGGEREREKRREGEKRESTLTQIAMDLS